MWSDAILADDGAGVTQRVRIRLHDDGLTLTSENAVSADWRFAILRRASASDFVNIADRQLRLTVADEYVAEALSRQVRALSPRPRYRMLVWLLVTCLALLLAVIFVPPVTRAVAALIPAGTERQIGAAMLNSVAGHSRTCNAPAGTAALQKLVLLLQHSADLRIPLTVSVRDVADLNAFAAPGGQIAILRGVIAAAESPEEVAGVLAHELGHVLHGDTRQKMVQFAALLVLGIISNDAGALAMMGVDMTHGREAERQADRSAIEIIQRADLPLTGFAVFFTRMELDEKKRGIVSGYFSAHPPTEERRSIVEVAQRKVQSTRQSALTPAEWQALKGICSQTGPSTSP